MENMLKIQNFIYTQIFNKIFEHKIQQTIKQVPTWIRIQQSQAFIYTQTNLNLFLPKFLLKTSFLKSNKKFYNNFLNLLPTIELFSNATNIGKQLALELARTKKYWRVIKSLEILLIKFFIQWFTTFHIKSQISGIKIIIRGRPGRGARTQKIIFKYGRYKQTTFSTTNTIKTFTIATAKTGSFGITLLCLL